MLPAAVGHSKTHLPPPQQYLPTPAMYKPVPTWAGRRAGILGCRAIALPWGHALNPDFQLPFGPGAKPEDEGRVTPPASKAPTVRPPGLIGLHRKPCRSLAQSHHAPHCHFQSHWKGAAILGVTLSGVTETTSRPHITVTSCSSKQQHVSVAAVWPAGGRLGLWGWMDPNSWPEPPLPSCLLLLGKHPGCLLSP